ncbi:hypothetical protein [Azospirillum sp. TSO22-1]|uniref:hypothetical protein n=1 Tax=Azospirillum sp. TSO22-1 TaxID=716789 RepID=UPI000D622C93|nr:hypothetical protein [Azospirillum sp. TSO22-1]PWC40853.1 hypothetical protein TSO221_24465 [Azospirillum sp. TSO22-1]
MTTYASPVALTFERADIDNGGFHLKAKVGGVAVNTFQVDTGSSGMVMSQSLFPSDFPWDTYPSFGSYTIHYYPSTITRTGVWYHLPVDLIGADGTTVSSHAMVLVCPDAPDNLAMMGVSAKGEAPAYNVFLQASDSSGNPLAPAYALTQTTVVIGQTHSAGDGYAGAALTVANPPITPLPAQTNTVPFTPPDVQAWNPPAVNVAFAPPNGDFGTAVPLAFELDTGINQFLVACPQSDIPNGCLGPENANDQWPFTQNSRISVSFAAGATGAAPALAYTVTIGEKPAKDTPNPVGDVLYMGPPTGDGSFARANVGICPINACTYLYDALNGFLGFKPL